MTNGADSAAGSPIFRCAPNFSAGKLPGIDASAPGRIVDTKDMAWGVGGQQFHSYLLDYAKHHPCEAVR